MNTQVDFPIVFVAIPSMDEIDYIYQTIECLQMQTYVNIHVFVCVNQPEKYQQAPAYASIVESNKQTIEMLKSVSGFPVRIIDRSSKGHGWGEKNHGVGWARKVLFDSILEEAEDHDIIVSLDADTKFGKDYIHNIVQTIQKFPQATGLSIPYEHLLTGDETLDRAMLRYEIYMRYYALNLWRVGSPYNFTALGSAIAFPVHAFRRIKGIAPKMSGEDFYLLQKLRKSGKLIQWTGDIVNPATRYSNRVFFGTGPALIRGSKGDWSSYPLYGYNLFDDIAQLYHCFDKLFIEHIMTPADDFIRTAFAIEPKQLWDELRSYHPDPIRFRHACHIKFDGLRILQFLRFNHFRNTIKHDDENVLRLYLLKFYPEEEIINVLSEKLSFNKSSIEFLVKIRNFLKDAEQKEMQSENNVLSQPEHLKNKQIWKYLGSSPS